MPRKGVSERENYGTYMPMKNHDSVFLIAEIAQAHDGSLGILHSYIDALAETGVDAIKFQMHIADAESSSSEKFRVNFSYVDKTRFDYWKRMELSLEQWTEVKKHCEDKGVEFLVSPFSIEAFHMLEKLGVKRYKLASGEISNYLMLDQIARTGKPIIISTGMSDYAEIEKTLSFLAQYSPYQDKKNITLLQCTTSYPTPPDKLGLNCIPEMMKKFEVPVGLSDHSGEIYPALAAIALGAKAIECHAVFDKRMFGPDAKSSLTIDTFANLVKGVRFLEDALKKPVNKNDSTYFSNLREMFGKSLAYNKELAEGHILQISDLETKKPSKLGLEPALFQSIIGKRLRRSVGRNEFVSEKDFVDG